MVDVVVSTKVAQGKMPQALEWAKKLITYEKKADIGGEVFILRPVTGEIHRFSFVDRYASMAEFEELINKRRTDSGWMEILKEGIESDWHLESRRNIYEVVE